MHSLARPKTAIVAACLMLAGLLLIPAAAAPPADKSAPPAATNTAVLTPEDLLVQRRAHQSRAHPLWRDLNWTQRVQRAGFFAGKLLQSALPPMQGALAPVAAGFQGNGTVIWRAGSDAIALRRQNNCSLTLLVGTYTLSTTNPTLTVNSQTANYHQDIRESAGLGAGGGAFMGGCAEATLGIGSRRGVYLGRSNQGLLLFAGSGYNYTAGSNVLYMVSVDDNTQQRRTFDDDASMPGIQGVAAGDLNGDGLADVIGIDYYDAAAIRVWLARADGTLAAPVGYALPGAGTRTSAAVTADIDGDGDVDVVVATRNQTSNQEYISVLRGAGNGTLATPQTQTVPTPTVTGFAATQIVNLIAADVRGRGRPDIVASNGLLLLNSGTGTFTTGDWAFAPTASTSAFGPNLAAGDFDGDGKLDLAIGNGADIAIWLGEGDGGFVRGRRYASIDSVGYLTATDLDGDGKLDLYVGLANGGFFGGDQFEVGQAYALVGNGDGSFRGAPAPGFVYSGMNLGDLDGDGDLDAVGVNADRSFTSYLNDGDGDFTIAGTLEADPLQLYGREYFLRDIDSYGLADVNSDGKADLLFIATDLYVRPPTGFDAPGVAIALGDGQGGFAAPTFLPSGHFVPGTATDYSPAVSSLRLTDTDDDGRIDIAFLYTVQDFDTSQWYAGVAIHRGLGDGTFRAVQTRQLYSHATQTPVGMFRIAGLHDLNVDDVPELLVMSRSTRFNASLSSYEYDLSLARGLGGGEFAAAQPVGLGDVVFGSYASSIEPADMNGDGKADLVMMGTASSGRTRVGIAAGNGSVGFATPVSTSFAFSASTGQGMAVADFNADGKLDVAIGSYTGSAGSGITFGNGDGTLQPVNDTSIGGLRANEAIYLNVGGDTVARDFNGDGRADLLSGATLLLSGSAAAPPPTTPAGFALSASSLAGTSAAGSSTSTTLTVTPSGGFTGSVSLSCSGLPAGASCNFNPASLSVTGGALNSTLTLSTTARTAAVGHGAGEKSGAGVLLYALLIPLLLGGSRRIQRGLWRVALLCAVAALLLSCVGGEDEAGTDPPPPPPPSAGTPAGNYRIVITATSGATSHSVNYDLTVS